MVVDKESKDQGREVLADCPHLSDQDSLATYGSLDIHIRPWQSYLESDGRILGNKV